MKAARWSGRETSNSHAKCGSQHAAREQALCLFSIRALFRLNHEIVLDIQEHFGLARLLEIKI